MIFLCFYNFLIFLKFSGFLSFLIFDILYKDTIGYLQYFRFEGTVTNIYTVSAEDGERIADLIVEEMQHDGMIAYHWLSICLEENLVAIVSFVFACFLNQNDLFVFFD